MERNGPIFAQVDILPRYGKEIYDRLHERPWINNACKDLNKHHPDTLRHSFGVYYIVSQLARSYNLPHIERKLLQDAAMLHDWGKKEVPLSILKKKGKPTEEEARKLQYHVIASAAMISYHDREIAEVVGYHHCFQSVVGQFDFPLA